MMCFCIALSSSWPSCPSFWSWGSLPSFGLVYVFVFWLSRVVLYFCSSHNQSNTLHYFWGLVCHWSCLPLFFAQLMAIWSIPGCFCSDLISSGLMIKCWNLSFLSNLASKPWNFCIVVAQLGTSGQNVTEQHDCFILHRFVFIGMGTCLIVGIIK